MTSHQIMKPEECAPQVLDNLKHKGIAIRVASPKLVMEEAPESYKVLISLLASCLESQA